MPATSTLERTRNIIASAGNDELRNRLQCSMQIETIILQATLRHYLENADITPPSAGKTQWTINCGTTKTNPSAIKQIIDSWSMRTELMRAALNMGQTADSLQADQNQLIIDNPIPAILEVLKELASKNHTKTKAAAAAVTV